MSINGDLASNILESLQNNIIASCTEKSKSSVMEEMFCSGAVWHGDWRNNSDGGTSFGWKNKPNHFAMILCNKVIKKRNFIKRPGVRLAPITSRKHTVNTSVFLPKNELRFGVKVEGYILPKFKLLIRKERIQNEFEYIQLLPEKYVDEARRVLNNG